MEKSYILVSLEDERAKHIAEVMANKTCKKILGLLAEKEMSESDISKELGMPLNTTEYNLKKLIDSGLAEKSKDYFWSIKGKKIPVYRLSNKYIVIAPKNSKFSGLKTVLPVLGVLGLGALVINRFTQTRVFEKNAADTGGLLMAKPVTEAMYSANSGFLNWFFSTPWAIFLAGGLIVLISYMIIKKIIERRSK